MEKLLLWVSVFSSLLSEAFAQTDLRGKVFVFPSTSSSSHVKLISNVETPLQNFTLCFRAYSDLTRGYSLFSYNTKVKDNELLVYKERPGVYSLYIGRSEITVKVSEEGFSPVHICTSWESSSGIVEFWINGKPLVKKGLQQGYSVGAHPSIVLGQEQDSYGGGFDSSQSFVGEIGDLFMWDYVLNTTEIGYALQDSPRNPNVLNWHGLNYEAHDYVVIKPRVWH